jgi:hypothetical protein
VADLQRMQPFAIGDPTHADWDQADVRPFPLQEAMLRPGIPQAGNYALLESSHDQNPKGVCTTRREVPFEGS